MKNPATYMGWGAQGYWRIDDSNDYPRLSWENTPGNLITRKPYPYGGGSGTQQDPYLIVTYEQLNTIGLLEDDWTKCFKLISDINCAGETGVFNVIGNLFQTYTETFDGNFKTIYGFRLNIPNGVYSGLFGRSGSNAKICNPAFDNPDVNVGSYSAVLLGTIAGDNTVIDNCFVHGGKVRSTGGFIGGLVGYGLYVHNNIISKSSVSADIAGSYHVGGLTGYMVNAASSSAVYGD